MIDKELTDKILGAIGGCERPGCSFPCSCAADIRQGVKQVIEEYNNEMSRM